MEKKEIGNHVVAIRGAGLLKMDGDGRNGWTD